MAGWWQQNVTHTRSKTHLVHNNWKKTNFATPQSVVIATNI